MGGLTLRPSAQGIKSLDTRFMRILFLAPQPFFQERGTPIAVRLALEVLVQRSPRPEIDLLVYHEGAPLELPGVRVHRIRVPRFIRPFLSGVRPGITLKKLVCDIFFFLEALRLAVTSRRSGGYHLVHAVEESVFIALLMRMVWRTPYLYDMDSSLSLQLTDTWRVLRIFRPLMAGLERLAVRRSAAVVPVCDTLAAVADEAGSPHTCILRDISLLDHPDQDAEVALSLREAAGIADDSRVILYVGNLERYQGIDLALEAFSRVADEHRDAHLVVIGGAPEHVAAYQHTAASYGASSRIHFLGPRPVAHLHRLITEADTLISPRILGNNTPMKIYSYLHSGKPLIATAIPSHTQVLTDAVACLCEPTPEGFARGLSWVLSQYEDASKMGERARQLAEERYTLSIFRQSLLGLYDRFSADKPVNRGLGNAVVTEEA